MQHPRAEGGGDHSIAMCSRVALLDKSLNYPGGGSMPPFLGMK